LRVGGKAFGRYLALVETEQVEGEEYYEEGGFGAEKLAYAKAGGRQIIFEFFNALLGCSPARCSRAR
jgi:hypothetical protein